MARPSPMSTHDSGSWTQRRVSDGAFISSNNGTTYQYSETTSGTSRRKPAGWIPPTPYSIDASYRTGLYGYTIRPSVGVLYRYDGYVGFVGGESSPVNYNLACDRALTESVAMNPSNVANRALIRARNNLKDMDIDLGTAFGERNQTARMIGDTASRLAKTVRHLRRGEIRNAMRSLGISNKRNAPHGSNWTSNWLELQYGWKPFLSDVYGAADALSKRDRDDWMVVAKGTVSDLVENEIIRLPNQFGDGDPNGYVVTAWAENSAFVRIDAAPSSDAFMHSLSSLGVTNPLNVAWELVPYSFVVDWFLPIGSWLQSLDATLGFTIRSCSTTTRSRAHWAISGLSGSAQGFTVINSFKGSKRLFRLNRVVTDSVPFPSFPDLKDPRSLGHMANGLSLLVQAFMPKTRH